MKIPVWLLAGGIIVLLTLAGLGSQLWLHAGTGPVLGLLSLFFSINLLVCYWEICLWSRHEYIKERTHFWLNWRRETGQSAIKEFLFSVVPFKRVLSPTLWADAWASYSEVDDSYPDRSSHGFNVDVGNGFVTLVPTVFLYVALTTTALPAVLVGIVGVVFFSQWIYGPAMYVASVIFAGKHKKIRKIDVYVYIFGVNGAWMLFALLGLYVAIRLIVDGDYSVLSL